MPAGSDFVCENDKCKHFKKKIVITGPWPMGDINKIVNAPNVAEDEDFRRGLLKLKEDGREYVCITYPNIDEIDIVAYRIHRWCPNCSVLRTYDAMIENENDTMEETIAKTEIPEKCTICDTELMDFNALIEGGMKCPFCKEKMSTNTWFANEITGESNV